MVITANLAALTLKHSTSMAFGEANATSVNQYFKKENLKHLDSCTPAFAHSVWHSGTWWVDHGHEADEAQVLSREVHFISIKSKSIWELVVRQMEVAET
uniref:Uncharacterized protein n=1 Tax=Poecilia mexicana TaxID=48701 RepID=A0A3B3Z4C2_9TELE